MIPAHTQALMSRAAAVLDSLGFESLGEALREHRDCTTFGHSDASAFHHDLSMCQHCHDDDPDPSVYAAAHAALYSILPILGA